MNKSRHKQKRDKIKRKHHSTSHLPETREDDDDAADSLPNVNSLHVGGDKGNDGGNVWNYRIHLTFHKWPFNA